MLTKRQEAYIVLITFAMLSPYHLTQIILIWEAGLDTTLKALNRIPLINIFDPTKTTRLNPVWKEISNIAWTTIIAFSTAIFARVYFNIILPYTERVNTQ